MTLLRYGPAGQERTGVLDGDGQVRDLGDRLPDLSGAALAGLDALRDLDLSALPPASA